MTTWNPSPVWQGEDAYIIGGGPSLRHFDWGILHSKKTIGCNGAYLLGPKVCKILIFGDYHWWTSIGVHSLSSYGGVCVACLEARKVIKDPPTWLLRMERQDEGLSHQRLGFNGNTGSLAVNLALLLGARRVFLLGFDMKLGSEGEANWHNDRYEKADPSVYPRFKKSFENVARDLPIVFPGRHIVNLSDHAGLDCFPRVSLMAHFGRSVKEIA